MSRRAGTWALAVGIAVFVLGLAALWKFTALSTWTDPERIHDAFDPLRRRWYAFAVVILTFVLAEMILFPVLVLVFVCGLAFGPLWGCVYALAGSVASAVLPFLLGRKLGRKRVERIGGRLVRRIASVLERRGIVAVFLVRKVPAPFTLVNLVCGACPITLRDFLLGTLFGMGTGVLLITVLGARIPDLVRNPRLSSIAVAVGLLFAPLVLTLLLQRWVNKGSRGAP